MKYDLDILCNTCAEVVVYPRFIHTTFIFTITESSNDDTPNILKVSFEYFKITSMTASINLTIEHLRLSSI